MIKKFIIGLIATFSLQAFAQSNIPSGTYVSDGGWGTLNIIKDKSNTTKFDIAAMGANGHGCGISGNIIKNIATVDDEPEMKCIVKFKETKNGINVIPEGDGCRGYCGMRASFDGEYLKITNNCLPSNIEKSRSEFKKLYKDKKYDEALAKLEPILNECSKTIHWIDMGWIRNDLAITYVKLKKFDVCAKVLFPLKDDAEQDEDDLKNNYPPIEAEMFWPIVKATKTNLKLCKVK
jgi:hypothetical protein